jgi:hypothetical protein
MLSSLPVKRAMSYDRFGNGAHDVERAVAIERRDFDREDLFDLSKATPERKRQNASACRGLEIKPKEGNAVGHGATVGQQFVFGRVAQSCEAEQTGVVTELARERCFGDGLFGVTTEACDSY